MSHIGQSKTLPRRINVLHRHSLTMGSPYIGIPERGITAENPHTGTHERGFSCEIARSWIHERTFSTGNAHLWFSQMRLFDRKCSFVVSPMGIFCRKGSFMVSMNEQFLREMLICGSHRRTNSTAKAALCNYKKYLDESQDLFNMIINRSSLSNHVKIIIHKCSFFYGGIF